MKKLFIIFIFSLFVTGGIAAQEAKNSIYAGVGLFDLSLTYERRLVGRLFLFVEAAFDASLLMKSINLYGAAGVKVYLYEEILSACAGLGPGINFGTADKNYGASMSDGYVAGFAIPVSIRWKIDVGQPNGFFLQPLLGYTLVIGKADGEYAGNNYDRGKIVLDGTLYIRFCLGWAF